MGKGLLYFRLCGGVTSRLTVILRSRLTRIPKVVHPADVRRGGQGLIPGLATQLLGWWNNIYNFTELIAWSVVEA